MSLPATPPAAPPNPKTFPPRFRPTLELRDADPWPDPVDGRILLDDLERLLTRFVILPKWASHTLALWTLHTCAFQLRDISTYLGIESPEKRCGKTTLLTVLSELVHRPIVAANISSPAFFRVIEEIQPTLLIDEADTLLQGNDELRGILNSGYTRKTAFVVRVANLTTPLAASQPAALNPPAPGSQLARFSSWCPKAIAAIGRLPDTLADRCIVIRMHRKTADEQCDRLRNLDAAPLRSQCVRFIRDHADAITAARPELPPGLSDRAGDIWEPLLVLADLAGGPWPEHARQAALALTLSAQEASPIIALFFDIAHVFLNHNVPERIFSRTLIAGLSNSPGRPWSEMCKGKPVTETWLAQQLRPYGLKPRTLWIGETSAKGYHREEFTEIFRRYIPRAEVEAMFPEPPPTPPETPETSAPPAPPPPSSPPT